MFKLIRQEIATCFDSYKDCLIIIDDQVNLKLYKSDSLEYSENLEGDFTKIFGIGNSFIIRRDDNTAIRLTKNGDNYQLNSFLGNAIVDEIDSLGDYFIQSIYKSFYPIEVETKLINAKTNKVEFTTDTQARHLLIDNLFLSETRKNLSIYQLPEVVLKSQFNLTPYLIGFATSDQSKSEDRIQNYFGLTGSVLWIGLISGRLLAIDVKNGSLEYQIGYRETDLKQFPFEVKEGDYLPYGEYMQLDKDRAELFGLRDTYFMQVDLSQDQPQRKYFDLSQSMQAFGISSSYRNINFPYDENYIYFCDDRQGKIGIFDRNKFEVVWSHTLQIEKGGIAQILEMKFANDHWYILDRNNVLHIYKRI